MDHDTHSATPTLLAAGQTPGRLYTHVGYSVASDPITHIETKRWTTYQSVWPGLVAVALVLCLRRRHWLPRAALAVVAVGLLYPVPTRHQQQRRVLNDGVLDTMLTIERLAADTEAQALALGRWPTPEEWTQRHGVPRTKAGRLVRYQLAPKRDEWADEPQFDQPFAVVVGSTAVSIAAHWQDSRFFGPDGLFGTADDARVLRYLDPRLCGYKAWPHARPPRDPKVKLPGWPTKTVEVVR